LLDKKNTQKNEKCTQIPTKKIEETFCLITLVSALSELQGLYFPNQILKFAKKFWWDLVLCFTEFNGKEPFQKALRSS
jgi:hypothetical protein